MTLNEIRLYINDFVKKLYVYLFIYAEILHSLEYVHMSNSFNKIYALFVYNKTWCTK